MTIKHGPGSVEHFHHFLLGFFVPLIYQISTKWAKAQFKRLIIRSCGPLDRLIRDLGNDRIEIIDRELHRQMTKATDSVGDVLEMQGTKLEFVTIYGCDYPSDYDKRKFTKVRDILLSTEKIQSEVHIEAESWSGNSTRILLIQRGVSPAFYNSQRSERKGSGEDRRSIANHEELYRSLSLDHAGCRNVIMETLSLARQIALFSLADIIIAQHGAALANLIWARPNATVVEIFPSSSSHGEDFFCDLSLCMGFRYRRVWQDHEHANVDIDLIGKIVAQSVASPPSRVMSGLQSASFRVLQPWIPIRQALRSLRRRAWNKAARLTRRFSQFNRT
ncbi:MAG: glycosyltransferase 61 family protein [Candidatus Korobacteraceae bacterium]